MCHDRIIVVEILFSPDRLKQLLRRNDTPAPAAQIPQDVKLRRCQCQRIAVQQAFVIVPRYVQPNLPKLLYIGFKLIPQIPYKIGV